MVASVGQTSGVSSINNNQATDVKNSDGVNGGPGGVGIDSKLQQGLDQLVEASGKYGADGKPVGAAAAREASQPLGTEKTLKFEQDLLKDASSKGDAVGKIDHALQDAAMPKDLRDSLEGLKGVTSGSQFNLNLSQKNALSTLQANPGVQPVTPDNIQSKIDDKKTSPELKQALERVRDDPALAMALDTGDKRNGGGVKADGNISQGDIDQLALQQKV